MKYEKTGKKALNNDAVTEGVIERNPTLNTLWVLVKKHRFGIVLTWAVVATLLHLTSI